MTKDVRFNVFIQWLIHTDFIIVNGTDLYEHLQTDSKKSKHIAYYSAFIHFPYFRFYFYREYMRLGRVGLEIPVIVDDVIYDYQNNQWSIKMCGCEFEPLEGYASIKDSVVIPSDRKLELP